MNALLKFLGELPPTSRLILNGDVLESTQGRLRKRHWKVLSALRSLSDDMELVWVGGNHDYDAENVAHLVGAEFVPHVIFPSGPGKVLATHGDDWDDFIRDRPVLTWLADWAYLLTQRAAPCFALRCKRKSKTFLRCVEKVRAGARSMARKLGCFAVVCGHTHHSADGEEGGYPLYYNCGCWTDPVCEFVTVQAGEISVREFHHD